MGITTQNDNLYDRAKEAIQELFGDTSVKKSVTRDNLETLIDEIQVMISALGVIEEDE